MKLPCFLGKGLKMLFCFSLLQNVPPLLSTDEGVRSYSCMNGLRFLAMVWIIYGHTWQLGNYILSDQRLNLLGEMICA